MGDESRRFWRHPLDQPDRPGASANAVVWSPDSAKIAFFSERPLDGSNTAASGPNNVWVVKADGSGAQPLTQLTAVGADTNEAPAWFPDGSKLVFPSSRALDGSNAENNSLTPNIWLMNADGSGATPLTKMTTVLADNLFPAWRP